MSTQQQILTINSAMTQLMRHIRRVDEQQGVGRARLSALAVLRFGGDATLTQLAAAEMVSRATMHHVINGLEADGMVSRKADPDDARRQLIRLTKKGENTINAAHQARIAYLTELASGLSEGDLAIAADTLDAMRNASWERA